MIIVTYEKSRPVRISFFFKQNRKNILSLCKYLLPYCPYGSNLASGHSEQIGDIR
jgi:hypothetical protein